MSPQLQGEAAAVYLCGQTVNLALSPSSVLPDCERGTAYRMTPPIKSKFGPPEKKEAQLLSKAHCRWYFLVFTLTAHACYLGACNLRRGDDFASRPRLPGFVIFFRALDMIPQEDSGP